MTVTFSGGKRDGDLSFREMCRVVTKMNYYYYFSLLSINDYFNFIIFEFDIYNFIVKLVTYF